MSMVHSPSAHTHRATVKPALALKEPTYEALEEIANAQWSLGSREGASGPVTLLDVQQHNACNHTLSGTIRLGDEIYGFIIDSGDWAGTVVRAWGDPEEVGVADEPEPQEPRTFLPRNPALFHESPAMWSVYLAWRKEPWFREMERSYNYDRHFQPGGKIEGHYRDKAGKRGLVSGYLSDLSEIERDSIAGKATTANSVGMSEANAPSIPTEEAPKDQT